MTVEPPFGPSVARDTLISTIIGGDDWRSIMLYYYYSRIPRDVQGKKKTIGVAILKPRVQRREISTRRRYQSTNGRFFDDE